MSIRPLPGTGISVPHRHELIMAALERDGRVTVSEISKRLQVSEMTIRRDLEVLEQNGALDRVHGGAVPSLSTSYEPPFALRAMRNLDAKQRIGHLASSMISDGQTVILDAGTTTLEVARALGSRKNVRIMALSLQVAAALVDLQGVTVMLPGGTVRPGEHSLNGMLVHQALSDLCFDTFFLTVGGVDPQSGITEYNIDDAVTKRAAFASARRRVAVADGSKLGKTAFAKICTIKQLDVLITDHSAPPTILASLQELGLNILVA